MLFVMSHNVNCTSIKLKKFKNKITKVVLFLPNGNLSFIQFTELLERDDNIILIFCFGSKPKS